MSSPEIVDPTFASLGLSEPSLRALKSAHYEKPTPIQARAIPSALSGRDVIGCAATGTGKTAAFVLPMVERLAGKTGVRGLVLAPTRELALQIAEHAQTFGAPRGVRSAILIGGVSMGPQMKALREAPQLLIATPGRLIDHLAQGTARLDGIEILVLDEADRMLDMGFKPQLTKILQRVPKQRQTLLFSATMAGEVSDFARAHLVNPVKVEVSKSGVTAARADQRVYLVDQTEKIALLMALLGEDEATTLVFTRTKHRADKVWRSLERAGHKAARIHANRSQNQRQQALEGFKRGQYRVLVATDIAARGIDVAEIGHVVNFDLPNVPADYVHRVGRTARAAASGVASSFTSPDEASLLRDIEKYTRAPVPRRDVPRHTETFQTELKGAAERQAHANASQPGYGVSGRPPGQAPGRHARTHRKPNHSRSSQPRRPQQDEGRSEPRQGAVVFSGSPRKRR